MMNMVKYTHENIRFSDFVHFEVEQGTKLGDYIYSIYVKGGWCSESPK